MTFPAFRQEVQTLSRFDVPPTTTRTDWMLGFQRRGVRRCECEIELPKPGRLPQTSQVAATETPSQRVDETMVGPGRTAAGLDRKSVV